MLNFNYGSPYFWDKVVLTKFISGCRMVWDLICGTSWFYKSKTEKVTGGRKSAILPNWCCLLSITVLFTNPWISGKLRKTLPEVCLLFQLRKISGKNSETNWWKHLMNSLKDFGICLAILTIGFGMRGAIYSGHIKSVLLLSKNFSGKLHKITKSSNID